MKFIDIKVYEGRVRFILLGGLIKLSLKYNKDNRILKNVFDKKYKKKVLISYITGPFQDGLSKTHTNNLECYTAAEIFDELGYDVDVIQYTNDIDIEKLNEYDVVYGFGKAYVKSLTNLNCISIYYGTGCSPIYQNIQTIGKGREFFRKNNINCFNMLRYVSNDYTAIGYYSDSIITLGNKFGAETFRIAGKKICINNINAFYYDTVNIDVKNKDIKNIKKNFLWFGSSGIIHKGLDLVIEVFKRRKDLNLTICGASKKELIESGLWKVISDNTCKNIKYVEWVDIESEQFYDIMNSNIATVFPSVSEGGAPAVLNVMANGGLIPIVSRGCSLDIEGIGIILEKTTSECIEKNIDLLLSKKDCELIKMSEKVKDNTRNIYSYNNYKASLTRIIKNSLKYN